MDSRQTGGLVSASLRIAVLTIGIFLLAGMARTAIAGVILDESILGGRLLVATDGFVTAEFLGSDAGYFNTLYLEGLDTPLFDKKSPLGSQVDLGSFAAGHELVFRLHVRNTGKDFFSGDPGRNPDGLAHAEAITTFDATTATYLTTVGFEDLLNGGDEDYNDFTFRLTNVIDPPAPVPAPGVLMLLAIGLAGLGYQRR